MRITAAVIEKADGLLTRRTIRLEAVKLEGPRPEEVLVRVTSCGVCSGGTRHDDKLRRIA